MGSAGLQWDVADVIAASRMNQKSNFVGTGAQIAGATTYAGMKAFCTTVGSGFVAGKYYTRNEGNTAWIEDAKLGESGDMAYPLNNAIGTGYASPSGVFLQVFADDCNTNTGWTAVGTEIDVDNIVADKIGCSIANNAVENRIYKSLGTTISDTKWKFEFEWKADAVGNGSSFKDEIVDIVLSAGTGKPDTSSQDCIFLRIHSLDTNNQRFYWNLGYKDGAGAYTADSDASIGGLNTTYYYTLERTDATHLTVSRWTTSDRSGAPQATKTLATLPATVTALTTVQIFKFSSNVVGTMEGDNLAIYDGSLAANTIDGNTATSYDTPSGTNTRLIYDLTSARDIASVAINLKTASTTVTALKIYESDTLSGGTVFRYITVADFTNNTWRFFPVNRASADKQYLIIEGVGTGVISLYEVKVDYSPAVADWNRKNFHRKFSIVGSDNGYDSN